MKCNLFTLLVLMAASFESFAVTYQKESYGDCTIAVLQKSGGVQAKIRICNDSTKMEGPIVKTTPEQSHDSYDDAHTHPPRKARQPARKCPKKGCNLFDLIYGDD
jgi:hypothetical protein